MYRVHLFVSNTGVKVKARDNHSPSMFACLLFKLYNLYLDKTFLSDKSMVLKHHPDKRKARGLKVGDGEDDYFTCITRGNDGARDPLTLIYLHALAKHG